MNSVHYCLNDNESPLVKLMTCHRVGGKAVPKAMMTKLSDVCTLLGFSQLKPLCTLQVMTVEWQTIWALSQYKDRLSQVWGFPC